MKHFVAAIVVGVTALSMTACTQQKPEGPAERIGRGVDEIMGGLQEMRPSAPPQASSRQEEDQQQKSAPYRDENLNRYGSLREQWEAEEAARRTTVKE